VQQHTRTSQQKSTGKLAYKPAFFRANLHFATETSLASPIDRSRPVNLGRGRCSPQGIDELVGRLEIQLSLSRFLKVPARVDQRVRARPQWHKCEGPPAGTEDAFQSSKKIVSTRNQPVTRTPTLNFAFPPAEKVGQPGAHCSCSE
jgi:hypothetical protein